MLSQKEKRIQSLESRLVPRPGPIESMPREQRLSRIQELLIKHLSSLDDETYKNIVTEISYNREKNGLHYCRFQF